MQKSPDVGLKADRLTPTAEGFVFLNNALLQNGHAVPMDLDAPVPLLG